MRWTLAGLAAAVVVLLAPSAAGADGTQLTRGVVGYGTVHVDTTNPTPPAECTSAQSNPGALPGNVNAGHESDCADITAGTYDACTTSGDASDTLTSCDISLTAQTPDPSGWAFDHWSGSCSGTTTDCTIHTSDTECITGNHPPCSTTDHGPFTAVAHFRDVRAPTPSFSQAPSNNSVVYSNTQSQQFTFHTNEDGEAPSFACQRDSGTVASCSSGITWSSIPDGVHSYCVHGTDASGLTGATCVQWEQETNPTASITGHPGATVNAADLASGATFTYSSNKSSHSADGSTLSFECGLDGSLAACPASGKSYNSISDGDHTFAVRADFQAVFGGGVHQSTLQTFDFTVDATPPDTTITNGTTALTRSATPTFAFSSTESGSSFRCKIDKGSYAACPDPDKTAHLADGMHTFYVRAVDPAGNPDTTPAHRSFRVDTHAPTSIASAPSSAHSSPITVRYAASDPAPSSGAKSVELWVHRPGQSGYSKVATQSLPSSTRAFSFRPQAKGRYSFYTRAHDKAGNYEAAPRTPDATTAYAP